MAVEPLVAVIMPSFNSSRHIATGINSVLRQTQPSLELFVADGGSKDATVEIVESIARTDRRVRLIKNDHDNGPAHARYIAIKASRSRYVAFLDADDYWLPRKLEYQLAFMEQEAVSFTFTYYRRISEDGLRTSCVVPVRQYFRYPRALGRRGIGTLTVVVRRELLTDDVISVWKRAGGEETLWWLLMLRKGVVARLCPHDLARYRDTAGSLSQNVMYTLRSVWRMYRDDLNLSRLMTARYYVPYLITTAIRKIRVAICSRFSLALGRSP